MMRRALLAAAFLAIPAGATPAQTALMSDFDGSWTGGDPAACGLFQDSANFAFLIQDGVLQGLESSCEMTNPVAVRDMTALLFDMQCVGEGDSWSYRALLMASGDGALLFAQNGSAQILTRCVNTASPAPFQQSK